MSTGNPPPKAPLAGAGVPGTAKADGEAARRKPDDQWTVEELLFEEAYGFDFFQAVHLLENLDRGRRAIGRGGPPSVEAVRFCTHLSLSFPPSSIYDLQPATLTRPPLMTVAFMGLTGPSGILPRHYTELLMRLQKEGTGPEKNALRDWMDLFSHRMISLFYRAWEKYRFYVNYPRGEYARLDPDPYTRTLLSLVGMGFPTLRNRLRVSVLIDSEEQPEEKPLAAIDDLVLLYYSGILSHRPRCALSLQELLQDFFQIPVRVQQFQGQWLQLNAANQSSLTPGGNNELGLNLVAGERVWDVQGKFRVRLGPIGFAKFSEFLPDRASAPQRKAFFLLTHLTRLYVGSEFSFDVQLVLKAGDVPACRLPDAGADGPRLGWDTWVLSQTLEHDADEATFDGEELRWIRTRELETANGVARLH